MNEQEREPEAPLEISASPKAVWKNYKVMIPLWIVLIALGWVALHYHVDKRVIGAGGFLFAMLSGAFAWLMGLIALLPIIGPLIVKVLSIGFIWLLNAVGYLVSIIAIKRGYSKDVLTYRGLTIAVIVGIIIGYILGKYI